MGLSFAIPIDVAVNVAEQLRTKGRVSRGKIGVVIQQVTKDLAESFGLDKPTGALVKPVLYAAQIGTATASKVEIGFYIDDEVLTGDQLNMKNVEYQITPSETWATNFEVITDGFTASFVDYDSYFDNGGTAIDAATFAATASWGSTAQTGWTSSFNPKVSFLNGDAGKKTMTLGGTHGGVPLGNSTKFPNADTTDYMLFKIIGNPVDAKVTGSTKLTFTMESASLYDYMTGGTQTTLDSNATFLLDPYTFDIII